MRYCLHAAGRPVCDQPFTTSVHILGNALTLLICWRHGVPSAPGPAFRLLRAMSGSKACHTSAPQHCMCMRNSCWRRRQDEDEDEDSTDTAAKGGAAGVLQNMQQKVAGVGQVRTARWSCTNTVGDAIGKRHMLMIEAG